MLTASIGLGLLAGIAATRAAETPTVAQQLEALSTEFYAFNMSSFLHGYNRLGMGSTEAATRNTTVQIEQTKYEAWISKLCSIQTDKETLRPLLKHADPKVRTLAMALLVNLRDPSVLPNVADLLGDDAKTFFGAPEGGQIIRPGGDPLAKNATVGSNARSVMFFYVGPATCTADYQDVFVVEKSSREPFDKYWSTHKDLKYCASWFATKIRQGPKQKISSHTDYLRHLRNVHAEIDRLPEPDRTWTLLWLSFDSYTGPITSKEELIPLLQKLGTGIIMEVLSSKEIPSTDPDIKLNPGAQRQMVRFLFKNSDYLTPISEADLVRRYRAEFEKGEPAPARGLDLSSGGKGGGSTFNMGVQSNELEPPKLPISIEFTLETNTPPSQ